MKILVKFPSRERPARFFQSLESVYSLAHQPDKVYVLGTFDTNDVNGMADPYIQEKLSGAVLGENFKADFGESNSKIHAVNRGMNELDKIYPQAADWDIVVVMSDDMVFCVQGWDEYIRAEMATSFPDLDGYLHFFEKDSHTALNVMTIKGRKYYERFNFLYHPAYKSLFCDNEQMEVAKMLGKYKFVHFEIFKHYNPAYNYENMPKDDMFIEQQEIGWTVDQQIFNHRKALNFEIEKWQNLAS